MLEIKLELHGNAIEIKLFDMGVTSEAKYLFFEGKMPIGILKYLEKICILFSKL